MKNSFKRMILLVVTGILVGTVNAQVSINTSGGDAAGIGGTVAYSIGQVINSTNNGPTGSVYQGVQNPFEIFIVGISEPNLDISMTVFPNPTSTYLNLHVKDPIHKNLSYQLYDLEGNLKSSGQIVNNLSSIDMANLTSTIYFIYVNEGNKNIQTFKIIKK